MASSIIKRIYILLLLMCFIAPVCMEVEADTIVFEYDDSGNCILKRKTIVLKNKENIQQRSPEVEIETEQWNNTELLIYPNPTKGILKIEIKGELPEQDYRLVVSDMTGKTIYKAIFEDRCIIDMTNNPSGTYILQILQGKEIKEWKIIKE